MPYNVQSFTYYVLQAWGAQILARLESYVLELGPRHIMVQKVGRYMTGIDRIRVMMIGRKAGARNRATPCFVYPVLSDAVKLLYGPELGPGFVLTLKVAKVP